VFHQKPQEESEIKFGFKGENILSLVFPLFELDNHRKNEETWAPGKVTSCVSANFRRFPPISMAG
jgi:hypothetical protein